ncbi:MAG: LEPR-XLL domain-containing protein [Planctomycetes bacterium]|nr:LEPR-XLL domain-containing protein [Planctomycetota bacterium]MBL7042024.1 LEPR-XLL domain-containing protein [Pirellulaceae bacterium]
MARSNVFRRIGKSRSPNHCFTPWLERLESRLLMDGDGLSVAGPADAAEAEDASVPNFALVDVNPASATYNHAVSPRDYLQQVSVWMFGYST